MAKKAVATAPAETALVVTPDLFEVVVLKEGQSFEDLPKPVVPYFVYADEGQFLYRDTAIGTVITKDYKKPPLGKIGYSGGRFDWDVELVPGRIISQATDFFRKVYDKYGTEAEVIITMHNETKEFRLFVPYQRTNGAGVKSIFEPTHIDKNYTVVGTLHSHCHFSAFHSGTDSGDAADMDGVHFTIGMLQNDPPQIVAMVAMSKKEFHFHKVEEIAELDFHADTAPDWWMNYVYPADIESDKPASLKSLTQAQWDEFRGIKSHVQTQSTLPGVNSNNRYQPNTPYTPSGPRTPYPTQEQRYDWRNRPIYGDDVDDPDSGWEDVRRTGGTPVYEPPKSKREERKAKKAQKKQGLEQEEDKLIGGAVFTKVNGVWVPKDIELEQTADDLSIDLALDTAITANIITADDWSKVRAHDYDDIEHWRMFFAAKLAITADILDTLGMEVNFTAGKKEETKETPRKGTVKKPVKGQTTIDEHTAPLEVQLEDRDGNHIPLPVVTDVTVTQPNSGKGQERSH